MLWIPLWIQGLGFNQATVILQFMMMFRYPEQSNIKLKLCMNKCKSISIWGAPPELEVHEQKEEMTEVIQTDRSGYWRHNTYTHDSWAHASHQYHRWRWWTDRVLVFRCWWDKPAWSCNNSTGHVRWTSWKTGHEGWCCSFQHKQRHPRCCPWTPQDKKGLYQSERGYKSDT